MLFSDYFVQVIYISLHPDTLTIRDLKSNRSITGAPLAAISRESKARLLGVGEDAKRIAAEQSALLLNPFKHPRSLLSDFTLAEAIIKGFVEKLFESRYQFLLPRPQVVMHPRVNPEGGFTQIELRALRELAIGGAGADKVGIWLGGELTEAELLKFNFDREY